MTSQSSIPRWSPLLWPTPSGLPNLRLLLGFLLFLVILVLAAGQLDIDFDRLLAAPRAMFEFSLHLFAAPDINYLPQLLARMWETIEMTLLATTVATLLSAPLGLLAAQNISPHPLVYRASRTLLSLVRAMPELVWALVFVSAVGLGPLPGIMALALVTVGFMAKFFAESFEVVGEAAIEGVQAGGATKAQIIRWAMVPQAIPDFIGTLLYILDHNLRAAAILGLVGAGGIGYDLIMATRLFRYERLWMIALAIYLVVTLLDRLSAILRERLINGAVERLPV